MQIDEVIWRICHHYEASIEEVDSSGKLLGSDHYLDRYGILVRNVSNSLLFYELLEQGECMNGNFVLWRSVSDLELANRICFQCISFEFFCQLIAHCLDVLLGLDENQHIPWLLLNQGGHFGGSDWNYVLTLFPKPDVHCFVVVIWILGLRLVENVVIGEQFLELLLASESDSCREWYKCLATFDILIEISILIIEANMQLIQQEAHFGHFIGFEMLALG